MKTFIMKADTTQSIIQWYWGTPTSSRSNDSCRPDLRNSTDGTTAKEPVVRIRDGTTANEPVARRTK